MNALSPRPHTNTTSTRCASAFNLFSSMRSRNLFHRTSKTHHSIFKMYDKHHHPTTPTCEKMNEHEPSKHSLRRSHRHYSNVTDYAAVSTQNSTYRKSMEDECVVVPQFKTYHGDQAKSCFFGVYDGHGGAFCSQYASKHFHMRLSAILAQRLLEVDALSCGHRSRNTLCLDGRERMSDVLSDETIEECYMEAFAAVDRELHAFEESSECGSTAVTCLVRTVDGRTSYHIANVGDSCAILCTNGRTRRLTVDHKATNEDEVRRIRASNGIIFNQRVAGVLAVTRALGHSEEKELITAQPHVISGEIGSNDGFIVLASDGVTDVYTDEELTLYISTRLKQGERSVRICKSLLSEAKTRGSMDNMTIIIVCF